MEKISCPICRKDFDQHDERQTNLCLEKFTNIATNPVVYSSTKKDNLSSMWERYAWS